MTKRAGRKKDNAGGKSHRDDARGGGGGVKRAVFESTKKKEVGVSDLTLISKISNEAINENLKKRFENAEIYVSADAVSFGVWGRSGEDWGRGGEEARVGDGDGERETGD